MRRHCGNLGLVEVMRENRVSVRSVGTLIVLGLLIGCSHRAPVPVPPARPATVDLTVPLPPGPMIHPGESIDAEVRVGEVVAARGTAQVGFARDAQDLLDVQIDVHGTGVVALLRHALMVKRTRFSPETGFPVRYTTEIELGDKERRFEVVLGRRKFRYQYFRNYDRTVRGGNRLPTGERAHDAPTAVLMLRGWRPHPGTRGRFYAVAGRRLWQVDVVYEGPVTLVRKREPEERTPAVRYNGRGLRLHPNPDKRIERKFSIWFSDDERRIPLRAAAETRFGEVHVDTVAYSPPPRGAPGRPD